MGNCPPLGLTYVSMVTQFFLLYLLEQSLPCNGNIFYTKGFYAGLGLYYTAMQLKKCPFSIHKHEACKYSIYILFLAIASYSPVELVSSPFITPINVLFNP